MASMADRRSSALKMALAAARTSLPALRQARRSPEQRPHPFGCGHLKVLPSFCFGQHSAERLPGKARLHTHPNKSSKSATYGRIFSTSSQD